MTILMLIVLAVLLIILGPLALIWSLNTLFGLGIAYTFKTWLAAFLLAAFVSSPSSSKND